MNRNRRRDRLLATLPALVVVALLWVTLGPGVGVPSAVIALLGAFLGVQIRAHRRFSESKTLPQPTRQNARRVGASAVGKDAPMRKGAVFFGVLVVLGLLTGVPVAIDVVGVLLVGLMFIAARAQRAGDR